MHHSFSCSALDLHTQEGYPPISRQIRTFLQTQFSTIIIIYKIIVLIVSQGQSLSINSNSPPTI